MKFQKKFIYSIFMLCIFSSCGPESKAILTKFTFLQYDKKYHILFISSLESARIIKKVELDMQQDTLIICNIYKKLLIFPMKPTRKATPVSAIKLQPNVEYVRCGDRLFKLSELNECSTEEEIAKLTRGVAIIDCPDKFPCKIP